MLVSERPVYDPARGRRALGQFVLIGLTLSIVAALMPHSSLGNRVGVATFGVLPIALGVLKPNGFWDAESYWVAVGVQRRWRTNALHRDRHCVGCGCPRRQD